MSTENGKQPAFPTTSEGAAFGCQGLTKMEWLAGMALQGICSADKGVTYVDAAEFAIKHADALLKALAESEGGNG